VAKDKPHPIFGDLADSLITVMLGDASPIERLFLAGLIAELVQRSDGREYESDFYIMGSSWDPHLLAGVEGWGYSTRDLAIAGCSVVGVSRVSGVAGAIFTQFPIGRYTADFAIVGSFGRVVVECDGHDFHERTKEQAAHDRQRDRWMQSQGWTVMRFTGSEIFKSPRRCAIEVIACIDRLVEADMQRWILEWEARDARNPRESSSPPSKDDL
jgi:very-short-patch-repair endonuclease